jgi:hypothetical protein
MNHLDVEYLRACFLLPTEDTVFLLRLCFRRCPKILSSSVSGGVKTNHVPTRTGRLFLSTVEAVT